ncbi:hypothetical protein RJ640_023076, partial [Escallonia rubra]
ALTFLSEVSGSRSVEKEGNMAVSYPYLLLLLLLSISLSIVVFVRKKNLRRSKLPPGEVGWPVVGETFEFKRVSQSANPESFIHDRMKKHSPKVFRTSLFGENMAVFCGASGNKFLFTNEYKLVTSWWPRSMKKALNYPSSSLVRNPTKEELTKKRRILQEILKPEALRSYVPLMDSMARAHLETEWATHEEVNVFLLLKNYTFALACRIFMGIDDPDHITRFSNPFAVLKAGLMSFPINIPGTTMNRSIKAGKIICEELIAIIKQRKHELSTKTIGSSVNRDLLSSMLLATDEDGKFMTEMEICNQILGSLIASHHTTSTVISFIVKYLAELPYIYREVYREQIGIARSKEPEELLNWDDLQKMKYSWNVACEAMRLSPPGQGAYREAITDFTYEGFTIPKGWKTYWNVYSTHKDPKYFPDPEKFDPSRFEGDGPAPYTFVPFGGGPRICPGNEYGRLEVLVFMHNVVTRFNLERAIGDDKLVINPNTIAMNGLRVRLLPRSK